MDETATPTCSQCRGDMVFSDPGISHRDGVTLRTLGLCDQWWCQKCRRGIEKSDPVTPPRIVPVAPIGRGEHLVFPNPGHPQLAMVDLYPPSTRGNVLRMVRIAADLSMGEAARLVGLDVVAWSSIENGRATLESDAAWCDLFEALAAEHERREDERRARRAAPPSTPPG